MAVITATVRDFSIVDAPPQVAGISYSKRLLLKLVFDNGATAVIGGTDTLAIDVNAAAELRQRQGFTCVVRSFQLVQPAQSTTTEFAATMTLSGTTLSLTPKTPADWSTNATLTASPAVPYVVHVLCDVS
jgi:hypothetical protein